MTDHIMHDHITALLDAGYTVELTSSGSVDSDEYYAHVRLGGGPLLTGDGKSPAEAIWTASPLHDDGEPLPVLADLIAEHSEGLKEVLEDVREVVDVNRKVRDLNEDLADALDRIDALEGKQGDMSALIFMLGDLFKRTFPGGYTAKGVHSVKTPCDEPVTEDGLGSTEGVIDSHVWYCAKCGGQCIGGEPANGVCRGCGGH